MTWPSRGRGFGDFPQRCPPPRHDELDAPDRWFDGTASDAFDAMERWFGGRAASVHSSVARSAQACATSTIRGASAPPSRGAVALRRASGDAVTASIVVLWGSEPDVARAGKAPGPGVVDVDRRSEPRPGRERPRPRGGHADRAIRDAVPAFRRSASSAHCWRMSGTAIISQKAPRQSGPTANRRSDGRPAASCKA